jgi:hypothetical protein
MVACPSQKCEYAHCPRVALCLITTLPASACTCVVICCPTCWAYVRLCAFVCVHGCPPLLRWCHRCSRSLIMCVIHLAHVSSDACDAYPRNEAWVYKDMVSVLPAGTADYRIHVCVCIYLHRSHILQLGKRPLDCTALHTSCA